MRMEPHINTGNVKCVAAFRQSSSEFLIFKDAQTYGTFHESVLLGELVVIHFVHEQRYLGNDGRFKALSRRFSTSSSSVVDVDGEGMEVMKSSGENLWDGNRGMTSVTGVN